MGIMMQKLSGKCLCYKIKFSREAEIQRVANCHCTDCQNVTGATYATLVSVAENMIKIDGTPKSITINPIGTLLWKSISAIIVGLRCSVTTRLALASSICEPVCLNKKS